MSLAADRAVAIGPAPAADSYLSIPTHHRRRARERRRRGPSRLRLLSENAAFAAACDDAGLVVRRPAGRRHRADGIEDRGAAAHGEARRADRARRDAGRSVRRRRRARAIERVGFPALVKASAGGGGKGMRACATPARSTAIQAARREAAAAFGDGTLYVERLIERPHHVEVQVFARRPRQRRAPLRARVLGAAAASEGHRREPVAALTPALRAQITEAAVAAARAAAYRNAGTVEFLVDLSRRATAVLLPRDEHAAAGRASASPSRSPASIWCARSCSSRRASRCRGASEIAPARPRDRGARLRRGSGPVGSCRRPDRCCSIASRACPGVRIDSGVAKATRSRCTTIRCSPRSSRRPKRATLAIARLIAALRDFPILGIRTNIPFLLRILEHPQFSRRHDRHWLSRSRRRGARRR